MKNNLEKELNRYYHNISKELPRSRKKQFLIDIKSGVNSYLANNPHATIEDIIEYIGEPNDIVDAYYDNEMPETLSLEIKLSHKILISIVITLALALLIYIVIMIIALLHSISSEVAYSETIVLETSQSDIIKGE